MRITTHYATSTISLPVTVKYTCEHCQHQNEDRNQYLSVTGNSRSSVFGVSQGMKESASKNAKSAYASLINDLNNKKFGKAGLTCQCSHCGKKPSWSSFIRKPMAISLIAFIIGIILMISILSSISRNTGDSSSWTLLIIAILPLIPFPAFTIINKVKESKTAALDDAYLPHFEVREK